MLSSINYHRLEDEAKKINILKISRHIIEIDKVNSLTEKQYSVM